MSLAIAAIMVMAVVGLAVGYRFGRRAGETSVTEAESHMREVRDIRRALDATLGAYRPYRDNYRIVFDIGEHRNEDVIHEWHRTRPHLAKSVYWCQFEAFHRTGHDVVGWDDIDLRVTVSPGTTGNPQQAGVVRLGTTSVPRALITFAPPSAEVTWAAQYRSPGYWDPLRQTGQYFQWLPPSVGPDEDGVRHSPVESVTFVFRLPPSLGDLESPRSLPPGVAFREMTTEPAVAREYEFHVDPASVTDTAEPIGWFLRLRRRAGE